MNPKHNNILLLTLRVFSATGGIEKVCRVAGKVLYEDSVVKGSKSHVLSMYDNADDAYENRYFPAEMFRGYSKKKLRFIFSALSVSRGYDVVLLSHINLLLVGWLIKLVFPRKKIVLFAHGIEIWGQLSFIQKRMIRCCDLFLPVSRFTSEKIQHMHNIDPARCSILNNCLDPYMPSGLAGLSGPDLRKRYGFGLHDKIMFTLSRLSSKERYKGYERVLEALVKVKKTQPDIRYLIAGSYDAEEKKFITELAAGMGLSDSLKLAGFIPDEELVAHFSLADLYIMPSMKEGFGIVFIEAMFYGLPVIAGNRDGSVDALYNGRLGKLVDPLDVKAIEDAVTDLLTNPGLNRPDRQLLLSRFSYEAYKNNFESIMVQ